MKKALTMLLTSMLLIGNVAHAAPKPKGQAAVDSANAGSNGFAWGFAIGGLAVIGTVVGITAASAASSPSTFSH